MGRNITSSNKSPLFFVCYNNLDSVNNCLVIKLAQGQSALCFVLLLFAPISAHNVRGAVQMRTALALKSSHSKMPSMHFLILKSMGFTGKCLPTSPTIFHYVLSS